MEQFLKNKDMLMVRESLIFLMILGINKINYTDKLITVLFSITAYFISRILWYCFKDVILEFVNKYFK